MVRGYKKINEQHGRYHQHKYPDGGFGWFSAVPAHGQALVEEIGEKQPDDNGHYLFGVPAENAFPGKGCPDESAEDAQGIEGKPEEHTQVIDPINDVQ